MIRSLAAGSILMPGIFQMLMSQDARADEINPLAPKKPQFPAKAKNVIFLYMSGGVSHLDTFDYKPRLIADAGKMKPGANGKKSKPLLRPFWDFKPAPQTGHMVSDLFPYMRECMGDICLINSMYGDHQDHFQATLGVHTGSVTFTRPSIGSWVSYGLGTLNQNLPCFVVLAPQLPYCGTQVWSSDFLPGCYQGTRIIAGPEPVPDLARRRLRWPSSKWNSACWIDSITATSSITPITRSLPRGSKVLRLPSACSSRCRTFSTSRKNRMRRWISTACRAAAPRASPGNA